MDKFGLFKKRLIILTLVSFSQHQNSRLCLSELLSSTVYLIELDHPSQMAVGSRCIRISLHVHGDLFCSFFFLFCFVLNNLIEDLKLVRN